MIKEKVLVQYFMTACGEYRTINFDHRDDIIQNFINKNIEQGYSLFSITPVNTYSHLSEGTGELHSGVLVTMILKDTK